MKKYNYLPAVLLLPLLCAPGAQAADNEVTGFVMPSVKSVNLSGNKAKFSEYGDPDSGFSGSVEVKSEAETGYVTFNADDIAQDTQNYTIEGGQYGKFRLDAFYNEIQHNNTFDAKTFYTGGVGTDRLTSPLSNVRYGQATTPAMVTLGNTFDYEISRDQYGAGLRLDLMKPFFANFSVSREDRQGLRPIGSANSSFPAELPEPVDYKTNIIQAEVGYGKDPYFASVGYTHSNFDNAYNTLYFTDIYATANQTSFVSLPPDNDYSKFDLKGRVKLPLKSALALAYSQSKAEADATLFNTLNQGGTIRTLTLADSEFNGRVDTTNYSAVLTSSPLDFLDGKIFYKNYDTKNKSDKISIIESGTTGQLGNDLFDYNKESYGIEAGLKLPGRVTLTPFYTKVETERPFTLLPATAAFNPSYDVTTDDNIYGINAKWKGTDFISANIGYERLDRDDNMDSFTMKHGTAVLDPYTRESYIASQKRDTYKLGFDVFPTDMLSLGFTLKHKDIDYDETQIGLTGERSNTYGVSANLTPNDTVSFSAYVDYETATREQLVRLGATTASTANPVDTIPTDAAYNATTALKDKSFDWGLGVNVIAIPKTLILSAQFDHTRSNGFADYTYGPTSAAFPPAGWTNDTIDFNTWDDYKKDALQLKGTYSLSAQVDLTGGYAYEKYRYSDGHYDNYRNVYNASATAGGYLSGANANPDYTANVVFLAAKYKF
ncbi:MAG: MtrB/PioB family decaheme-associated outer membrane protein [Desulfurivibrionaceae bacterium]|jgi:MtrB/PioB family decaheme-associated outer membrane protein